MVGSPDHVELGVARIEEWCNVALTSYELGKFLGLIEGRMLASLTWSYQVLVGEAVFLFWGLPLSCHSPVS